jgi:hypothetical protein
MVSSLSIFSSPHWQREAREEAQETRCEDRKSFAGDARSKIVIALFRNS